MSPDLKSSVILIRELIRNKIKTIKEYYENNSESLNSDKFSDISDYVQKVGESFNEMEDIRILSDYADNLTDYEKSVQTRVMIFKPIKNKIIKADSDNKYDWRIIKIPGLIISFIVLLITVISLIISILK